VRARRHIPSFIIHSIAAGKPGIFLLRKPADAVVSWAIFWEVNMGDCLDYYVDFHRALLSWSQELFVVSFEAATGQFGEVIHQFNRRFGTNYATVNHDDATRLKAFSMIEEESYRNPAGTVNERRVSRPSDERAKMKPAMLERLRTSALLREKLEAAEELHNIFAPARTGAPVPVKTRGNREVSTARQC
jgi:hypothetical protein